MESVVRIGAPLFAEDTVTFGILMAILALIFYATTTNLCKPLFRYIPALLLCYFIPAIFTTLGFICPAWFDLETATSDAHGCGH